MTQSDIRSFELLQMQYALEALERGEITKEEYNLRISQHQQHIEDTFTEEEKDFYPADHLLWED